MSPNPALYHSADDLTRYLEETKRFPMLSVEEEQRLARLWRDHGDREAAEQLAGSHLRLVVKIARGFSGYGLPLRDLIAEGNVGLSQALEKFDPDRGFRFATYAMWWIRAAIQEHILHSWSLVKTGTTASQKKLFFNLRTLKNRLRALEEGSLTPEMVTTIAERLGVPEHDVIIMNERMSASDQSLNAPLRVDGDGEWQDWLVDERPNQEVLVSDLEEMSHRRELLAEAMHALNERERHILSERRLAEEPQTLEALSQHYGVSRERVRQIEVRAFEKLQKAVKGLTRAASMPPPGAKGANDAGLHQAA
ncbi:MAG: RNA polymerase sigma factor RpoH [Azospirillaceae bacterium]